MEITTEQLVALADEHLPGDYASAWKALILPCVTLRAANADEPVIATLGGQPKLGSIPWPVWEGKGPLDHVLSIDCAAVGALLPELGLPMVGTLAFFYFDGHLNHDVTVGFWDATTAPGHRVLYLTGDDQTPTPYPVELQGFTEVPLTGNRSSSGASYNHPSLGTAYQSVDPASLEVFTLALNELQNSLGSRHQVGGHAHPIQDAVEFEVAEATGRVELGDAFTRDSDDYRQRTTDLHLLAQVDSDHAAAMSWGDMGMLYWQVTSAERESGSWESAGFTWQCS